MLVLGPILVAVIGSLTLASVQRLRAFKAQKIDATRSIVRALSQDLIDIELLSDQSRRSDMALRLGAFPEIEYLVSFDRRGRRFYYYRRPDLPPIELPRPVPGAAELNDRHLHLHEPLIGRGGPVGSVYVRCDIADVDAEMRQDLAFIAFLGLGLLSFAFLASWMVRRVVTDPIERLVAVIRWVAAERDYSLRIDPQREDELGYLMRGVNDLLARTQAFMENDERLAAERELLITELEGKNAELERFTYTVSHDLRSPLVTIRGFVGLLRRDLTQNDPARVDNDLRRIEAAAERMHLLFADLLELSRIGRIVHPDQEVALGELAQEAVELVSGALQEQDVAVEVAPGMPTVVGDRPRLLEVFQNLVENAAKFTGEQPAPRIEIGARVEADEVICHVRDNGAGFDPRYQQRIFKLFERLDQTIEGTGIGLALVKRIVELHGGRIWAESEGSDRGATFFFSLPLPPRPPAAP